MFANFNKVFNSKPIAQTKVPDILVEEFNKTLPEGVRYKATDDGNCSLISVSEDGSVTFGGFVFEPTEDFKKILGEKFTFDEVLQYSYNSQKPIPVKLQKDGCIIVNGKEFLIDRLEFNPFRPINYVAGTGKCFAYPSPFPPAHKISLGTQDYSQEFKMQRVANDSLNTIAFESEKERPLRIKYFFNMKEHMFDINVTIKLEFANSIRDIVESISIYNAFIDGNVLMSGKPLGEFTKKPESHSYNEDSLKFWEKVLQVETVLQLNFMPSHKDIPYDKIIELEELYQNLICKKPYRSNQKITSIDGNWNMEDEKSIIDYLNKPLYFQFNAERTYDIFGESFSVPCIIGIFNAICSSYEHMGEKYKISLDDLSHEKPMYTSILCFKNQEEIEAADVTSKDFIESLQNAKSPSEYLK